MTQGPETRTRQQGGRLDPTAFMDEPAAHVSIVWADEVADVRRATIQVRDRLGVPWLGRWLVRIILSETESGPPSAGQVVTVATGDLVATPTPDQDIEVLTDEGGVIVIDVEVSGPGSRWLHAHVLPRSKSALAVWG